MSKKSLICTILALSMILVGTGYAYWTDTLNVTTKATTGDLDVTFADMGLYAQYGNEYESGNWSIIDGIGATGYVAANYFERGTSNYNIIAKPGSIDAYYERAKGYNNVEFDAELVDASPISKTVGPYVAGQVNGSDNILFTIDNMYPGYAMAFRSDILNLGSIAARLSAIKFDVTGLSDVAVNETTKNMLGVAFLVDRQYQTSPYEEGTKVFELCKEMGLQDSQIFEVGGVHFIRFSSLADISKAVLDEYSTLLAVPSENRMDLYIAIAMDPDADGVYTTGSTAAMKDNDDSLSQITGAQLSVDFLWDQFNEGFDVDATNRLAEQNHDTATEEQTEDKDKPNKDKPGPGKQDKDKDKPDPGKGKGK